MNSLLSDLLREPARVAERAERPEGLRELALASLTCVVLGAGAFGGVLGAFRGGTQIAYAALKLPLALLITLVVCVPAFFALAAGFGSARRFATIGALSLAASARAALVLLACAPVLWLALDRQLGYHGAIILAALMYLSSGLAAMTMVVRGLGGTWRALATSAACALVFFAVLGQTAWGLRPFVGRPSDEAVPFIRTREGSFADALVEISRSALSREVRASLTRRSSQAAPNLTDAMHGGGESPPGPQSGLSADAASAGTDVAVGVNPALTQGQLSVTPKAAHGDLSVTPKAAHGDLSASPGPAQSTRFTPAGRRSSARQLDSHQRAR